MPFGVTIAGPVQAIRPIGACVGLVVNVCLHAQREYVEGSKICVTATTELRLSSHKNAQHASLDELTHDGDCVGTSNLLSLIYSFRCGGETKEVGECSLMVW